MTQRETPQVIGVRHVGLSARDPAALPKFYRNMLALQVVPVVTSARGVPAFLNSCPAEASLALALFANPAYQHIAFTVLSLADHVASDAEVRVDRQVNTLDKRKRIKPVAKSSIGNNLVTHVATLPQRNYNAGRV
jgi:hypothetical protein